MPHNSKNAVPDTGSVSIRRLWQLVRTDATIALTAAGLLAVFTSIVCYWQPEWSGTLIPCMILCVVLVCGAFGWVDAHAPPRPERSDSTGVHYTRRGAVEVPNM